MAVKVSVWGGGDVAVKVSVCGGGGDVAVKVSVCVGSVVYPSRHNYYN